MAFKNRSPLNHAGTLVAGGLHGTLFAAILGMALVAALGLRAALSLDALAPVVATVLFVLAAAAGGLALLVRRRAPQPRLLDIAGMLTFVGVFVSIMIEPDQMVRLMSLSEQPD